MSANNDKIAQLAYQIWDQEGRPEGRDMEHWLHAEANVAAQPKADKPKAVTPGKPKAVTPGKPKAASSGKPKAVPAGKSKAARG